MPKNKNQSTSESSSDSDSGPDDRNAPPPQKKPKAVSNDSSSSVPKKPADKSETTSRQTSAPKINPSSGKPEWTLEKLRKVTINEFRGRKMADIREHYEKDGKELPGKKGISLTLFQWKALLENADEITAALQP